MTTIGKKWLLKQEIVKRQEAAKEGREAWEAEAKKIIGCIPALINAAVERGESSIKLYGWMTGSDVPGESRERVDVLYDKQRRTTPLKAEDLAGCARIIFDWCAANDLECFMVSQRIPMNANEYNLYARPKQGQKTG